MINSRQLKMKRAFNILALISALTVALNGQKVPTGNPKDFKVKSCLRLLVANTGRIIF
jgi:hypothetical protein